MSEARSRPAAIVLAAGAASRMGTAKQVLKWQGETLVGHAIRVARSAGCEPVVVVTGAHAEAVRRSVEPQGAIVAFNEAWRSGLAGSIRAGLARLLERAPGVEPVFLLLCDQPFVEASVLDRLGAALASSGLPAAACRYGGVLGAPALFRRSLFEELRTLRGDEGARSVLSRDPSRIAAVDFSPGNVDLDTPEDLARFIALDRREATCRLLFSAT